MLNTRIEQMADIGSTSKDHDVMEENMFSCLSGLYCIITTLGYFNISY